MLHLLCVAQSMDIFPTRLRTGILLVVFLLGLGAAIQGIDERKATLAIVVAYGIFYGGFRLFRKYRKRRDA
jgi:hypothetical protein